MKKLWILILASAFVRCTSFDKLSDGNRFGQENGYVKYTNQNFNIKSLTFGDFQFASSAKEYKKLNPGKPLRFKNVLLYAKTAEPDYEYYILGNTTTSQIDKNFTSKDTVLNNHRISVLISKNAPESDKAFIFKHIYLE